MERSTPDLLFARWAPTGVLSEGTVGNPTDEPVVVADRYQLVAHIGSGRFGRVYRAVDYRLRREVALKTVSAHGADEAIALARVSHRNVVTVHDHGVDQGVGYLVMELLDGPTLGEWRRAEPRRRALVLQVFADAARGLAAIHEAGLVHRDFKPDNVIIDAEGRAVVADLGIAQSPASLRRGEDPGYGTPKYMAPEHVLGGGDAAGDQFAWAIACWESLTGEDPFDGVEPEERLESYLAGPRRPGPGGRIERVLRRALQPDPGARWGSMADLLSALDRERRARKARPIALGAATAAVLAVVLGLLPRGPSSIPVAIAELSDGLERESSEALMTMALEAATDGEPEEVMALLEGALSRAETAEEKAKVAQAADDCGLKAQQRREWALAIEAHSLAYELYREVDSEAAALASRELIKAAQEGRLHDNLAR